MHGPGRVGSVGVGMREWRGRGVEGVEGVGVVVMGQRQVSKWRVSVEVGWGLGVGVDMAGS